MTQDSSSQRRPIPPAGEHEPALLAKALYRSLLAVGLALTVVFVVDAVAGQPLVGIPSGLVLLAGILLMAAGLVGLDSIEVRHARRTWRRLADQMGLTFQSKGSGHAFGTYRGRHVHIHTLSAPSQTGRIRDVEMVVRVALHVPVGEPFSVHVGTSIDPLVGAGTSALEEIVAIAGEQKSYRVTGSHDLYTRVLLACPWLREQLARLRERSTIRASDSSLTLRQPDGHGLDGQAAYLFFVLDLMSDLAEALDKTDPGKLRPEEAVEGSTGA